MWSEPPDLNGVIGTSEQIEPDLETEIVNDFVPTEAIITRVTWWGGYYNNSLPCESGIQTPGFILRFYEDADCDAPCPPLAELLVTDFSEEYLGCQNEQYPLYKWSAAVELPVIAGNTYWFSSQMINHPFPPQAGRLASLGIVNCASLFWVNWFDVPPCQWTPCSEVFGVPYDASQEFYGDHYEACCFPDGRCEFALTQVCQGAGGAGQGPGTVCDPNPCSATATRSTSWGGIRSAFR
jgi:hypothetical protein